MEHAESYIKEKPPTVPAEFLALAECVMEKEGWQRPHSAADAKQLYLNLVKIVTELLAS